MLWCTGRSSIEFVSFAVVVIIITLRCCGVQHKLLCNVSILLPNLKILCADFLLDSLSMQKGLVQEIEPP